MMEVAETSTRTDPTHQAQATGKPGIGTVESTMSLTFPGLRYVGKPRHFGSLLSNSEARDANNKIGTTCRSPRWTGSGVATRKVRGGLRQWHWVVRVHEGTSCGSVLPVPPEHTVTWRDRENKKGEKMITIGSDPEFGLEFEDGKQAKAHDYLPNNGEDEIGCDGHADIGELRPRHGETPREHLGHIASLMTRVGRKIPAHIKITAGSMVAIDAIGGHIHFGNLGSGFPLRRAARALDYYLALPVALIEVQSSAKERRTRTGYGELGQYRRQPWGFEYRTLPSWLMGWGVALSILSIGYAVVDAIKQKSCPVVPEDIPNIKDFNNCNKKALLPLLSQIKKGWREMPLYSKFRLEVAFLNHLLMRKMEWREEQDVRQFWSTSDGRRPNPRVVGNPNDLNCPQIAILVKGRKGMSVFIYGLNPDRETDVAVSDLDMVSDIDIGYRVESTMYGVAREYDGWLCIGLSYTLRQDVHAAANLINKILGG